MSNGSSNQHLSVFLGSPVFSEENSPQIWKSTHTMLYEGMIWGWNAFDAFPFWEDLIYIVVSDPRLDVVRNHRILDDLSSKLFPFHLSATSRFSRHCEKSQVPKWNCQRTEDFGRNWPPTAGNGAAASFHFQQDANLRGGPSVMANQWPNLTGWGNAIGTQTCQHHTMPLGLGCRRNKGVSTSPLRC